MTDGKKGFNVGHSTNLTIGGRTYKGVDIPRQAQQLKEVHTVTGTENVPRDISKTLHNEAGTVKTNISQQIGSNFKTISSTQSQGTSFKLLSDNTNTSTEEKKETPRKIDVIASKMPTQGATFGAAYYTTLAAGRHDSMKSNIDSSKIQTASMLDKAAEARAYQGILKGSYTPSSIMKNMTLEAKASFYEAMGKYSSPKISLSQNVKNALSASGKLMVGKAQGELSSHDDIGTQTASGAMILGTSAYAGFKMAQTASPMVIDAVKNLPTTVGKTATGIATIGKGAWDVTTTAGKATLTLAKTAQIISSGFVPFNAQFTKSMLLHQAQVTGLLHTATTQHIISGVKQIQTQAIATKKYVVNTAKGIQTGVVTATNAVKRTYTLVRGVVNGSVMGSVVAHQALQNAGKVAKKAGLVGLKYAGQGLVKGTVKGGVWAVKKGLPKTAKGVDSLSLGVAGILTSSNDMMLQGVGYSTMLANYGIKTSVVAGRTTGRVIKTSIKGGKKVAKGTYDLFALARQKGLRAAWNKAKSKTATVIVDAGKSVVSALINFAKSVGSKVLVPILIIAVLVSTIMSTFAAPTVAIGSIFSGLFDTDNEDGTYSETDIRDFITNPTDGIPAKRTAYINDLYDYMQKKYKSNGGSYDYVRFKTNTEDAILEPTLSSISKVFYTEDELTNIIQPIFNAVILKDYELAPTDAQARKVLKEIFDKLFNRTEASTTEYCGQSATDGSGTPQKHSCGYIHAKSSCPNPDNGTHTSFTCSSCCYNYCSGHERLTCTLSEHTHSMGCFNVSGVQTCRQEEHTHSSSCYSTYSCRGCKFKCRGYSYCGGHNVCTVTLNMDGLYQLLYVYFEKPIDDLSSKANLTDDEKTELANLKDCYEICQEYINQVSQSYGGGMTMEDLSGVKWTNGSRNGNQAIIDLALSQAGQKGGQPYWSYYGFNSRVSWCACFVSWCMEKSGHSEVHFSSCQWGGVPYFKNKGCWADGGYTNLAAGDVIFFDWDLDGQAEHTGLVIGVDDKYVYTIEGNSSDMVRSKKYDINSSVIMGYGLMNW